MTAVIDAQVSSAIVATGDRSSMFLDQTAESASLVERGQRPASQAQGATRAKNAHSVCFIPVDLINPTTAHSSGSLAPDIKSASTELDPFLLSLPLAILDGAALDVLLSRCTKSETMCPFAGPEKRSERRR
jgi:hypothetical protein